MRRGVFAAYNQHYQGRGNIEDAHPSHSSAHPDDEGPPDLRNGFHRSETTLESMQRSYRNRARDANNLRLQAIFMSKIQEEQERSHFGQKTLTLEAEMSGEDDDFVVMNTCKSMFDQQPQVVIHRHYHEKKKKNKKKRSSSTSSSSDESSESRRRRKEKKKKRRKRKHSSDGESSGDEGRTRSKKKAIYSEFDKKRNPWKLLRQTDWGYKPFHMVVDTYGDPENAKYDNSHRGDVPNYRAPNSDDSSFWRVFSELFKGLLSNPENSGVGKDQRMFSERVMKQWGKCAPERTFRNRKNDKTFENYVKISHAPCAPNEEGAISLCSVKHKMDQQMLCNINMDDFTHIMRSQNASYEEALESDVQTRYSILQSTVLREPNNVDAWLKFVDIQREMQAKNESGDPKAAVQNTKALFEKMEEVIKRALEHKNVSQKNPRVVELHLKHQKILEEHFSPQSEAVIANWERCENRFINSITMWRENIKMRQNDRAVFDLKNMVLMGSSAKTTLPLIDRCIKKLIEIKNGTIKSHAMLEGTEQFLVDLLVQRCRLQVVSGYIAKAVAVLQALAEFHFFRPEVYKNFRPDTKPCVMHQELKKGFKAFWCSGLPRIGEPCANGWLHFDSKDVGYQQTQNDEAELLETKWNDMQEKEKALLTTYKGHGLAPVEVRRRLEKFRTKWFWMPVHFKHDDERLYEHQTRIVGFEELEPLLFPFSDTKYVKDLIFKLLHILGIPIPDVFIETQENILRHFSRSYFYSNSPISMELDGFDKFIELFVTQIAESPLMDSPRIYTALITSVSNSPQSIQKKYFELKQHVRGKIQSLKRHGKETKLTRDVQLSLYLTAFEEMVKVKHEQDDTDQIHEFAECDMCFVVLHINLDEKKRSLWEIGENETGDSEKRKERLFFMRLAVFLARQLPFSTDPSEKAKKNRAVKIKGDETIGYLATKREFLLSIFHHGRIQQVPENAETKEAAKKHFLHLLSRPAALTLDDPLRWIGDENELVFELCSYYAYEFPLEPKLRFGLFIKDDSYFYGTKLAVLLKERPCVQETRIAILQHIVATSSFFTPGELRKKLSQLVQRFPHNIPILKALLCVGSDFHKRRFLAQHPGTDDRSRLIRTCGRIFAAHTHYLSEHKRYDEQKYDNQAFRTLLFQYVILLRKAAEENCGNSLPDDYIWVFLMRHMTTERNMIPKRVIDEVFTLGQGRCPWSKQFLMESLRGCCDCTDPFVTILNATMKTHGISTYCTDPEVQLLLAGV